MSRQGDNESVSSQEDDAYPGEGRPPTKTAANLLTGSRSRRSIEKKGDTSEATFDPLLGNPGTRFSRGFLSFTIDAAVSGVEFAEPDVCYAFSEDHTRLISYDNGIFRAWRVPDFVEICRTNCQLVKKVVSISFTESSTTSFIAVYNDLTAEAYKTEEYLLSTQAMMEKDDYFEDETTSQSNISPDREILSDVDWISSLEEPSVLVHCAICRDDEIAVSFFSGRSRSWMYLKPSEYFKAPFKYSHAYFRKRILCLVGRLEVESGKDVPCVGIFTNLPAPNDQIFFSSLEGGDGMITSDSSFVVTWDSCHRRSSTKRRVYVYETRVVTASSLSTSRLAGSTVVGMSPTQTPRWVYTVADGTIVLHARIVRDQRNSVRESWRAANILDPGTKLVLLCDVSWAQNAKIFVIDVPNRTVDFQFETQFFFKLDIASPFALTRQLYEHRPFILSPDHRWIFLMDPGNRRGFLFASRNEHPMFILDWSHDTLFIPTRMRFSLDGKYISVDDGFRQMHFSVGSSWTGFSSSEMRHLLSPDASSAVTFLRRYDTISLWKAINKGFSYTAEPRLKLTGLIKNNRIGKVGHRIEVFGKKKVLQAIFSEDKTIVAFVIGSDPIRIEIWKTMDLLDGDVALSDERKIIPLQEAKVDTTIGTVLATFYTGRKGNYTFAVLLPHQDGVSIAKIRFLEDKEALTLHVIRPRGGGSVLTVKESSDGRRALIIFQSGRFAVVNTQRGFISETTGRLRYPCSIDFFVETFVDSTFIHIAENGKSFMAGWNGYRRRVVKFSLGATDRKMEEDYKRNYAMYQANGLDHILWANDRRTRVAIHGSSAGPFSLAFYDISGKETDVAYAVHEMKWAFPGTTGIELTRIAGSIPLLTSIGGPNATAEWSDGFDPAHPEDLRAFSLLVTIGLRELPPDFKRLTLLDIRLDVHVTTHMITKFGENIVNAEKPEGKSVLHLALMQNEIKSAELLFDYAKERGISVNLSWGNQNILGWAIDNEMYDTVEFILQRMSKRCTTPTAAAYLLRRHIETLLEKSPAVVESFLMRNSFCFDIGHMSVPISVFRKRAGQPVAMSSEYVPSWCEDSPEELKEFWIRHNDSLAPELRDTESVQVTAVSKFVCIEAYFHRRPTSVLRKMVGVGFNSHVFKTDSVSVVVQWMWHKFLRKPFIATMIVHIIAALLFALYAVFYGGSHASDGFIEGRRMSAYLCLSFSMLCQLLLLTESKGRRIRCLSVTVSLILLVTSASMDRHSTFTAFISSLQVIYLWFSILWYLQPFNATASLTSMIRYMPLDIHQFLLLNLVVVAGFGTAMRVLYISESDDDDGRGGNGAGVKNCMDDHPYCDETYAALSENEDRSDPTNYGAAPDDKDDASNLMEYSSMPRTLQTMYFAMLGVFNADLYREPHPGFISFWRSFLFCVYVFVAGIVLISLLVAVLSDTYDKVKLTLQGEVVKSRARIVGVWDGWFNIVGRRMKKEKKYFHFLVPEKPLIEENHSWEGRITEITKLCKREMDENDMITVNASKEVQHKVSDLKKDLSDMRAQVSRVEDQMNIILDRLSSLDQPQN